MFRLRSGHLNPSTNCALYEIANDGIYFDYPAKLRFNKTVLPPGSRADWLISCKIPGVYEVCLDNTIKKNKTYN